MARLGLRLLLKGVGLCLLDLHFGSVPGSDCACSICPCSWTCGEMGDDLALLNRLAVVDRAGSPAVPRNRRAKGRLVVAQGHQCPRRRQRPFQRIRRHRSHLDCWQRRRVSLPGPKPVCAHSLSRRQKSSSSHTQRFTGRPSPRRWPRSGCVAGRAVAGGAWSPARSRPPDSCPHCPRQRPPPPPIMGEPEREQPSAPPLRAVLSALAATAAS